MSRSEGRSTLRSRAVKAGAVELSEQDLELAMGGKKANVISPADGAAGLYEEVTIKPSKPTPTR